MGSGSAVLPRFAGLVTMSTSGSISVLIRSFRDGDDGALAALHARYWPVLVSRARQRLHGAPLREADEEDVAQQAFWSFVRSLRAGLLPKVTNRHDLLAILTHITACKVVQQLEREFGTQKRGLGRIRSASTSDGAKSDCSPDCRLQQAVDAHATPGEEALLRDSFEYYLQRLPEKLRELARLHLAGYSHREIAERLGCVERTIERKVALLRIEWERLAAESSG